MEEINCLDFQEPEIRDGEIVVPVLFSRQTAMGTDKTTIYLNEEKLKTLSQKSIESTTAIKGLKE